jgi:hypothetical protein
MHVIPGGWGFWSLFAYLEMVCTLNLEMSDCWPMLSKFEWFQNGNTAFCSFRQHSSSSINQSSSCLRTLTVTHADSSFSVTVVLTLGRQRKALWEKEMTRSSCPWQPLIWSQQWRCRLHSKQCCYFVILPSHINLPRRSLNQKICSLLFGDIKDLFSLWVTCQVSFNIKKITFISL